MGKVQAGAVVAKLCQQQCSNRDHCVMESYLNRLHNVGEQLELVSGRDKKADLISWLSADCSWGL